MNKSYKQLDPGFAEAINIAALPSLPLSDAFGGSLRDLRRHLPNVSAVYLVLEGDTVIYIGRTKNLHSRWRGYHQKAKRIKNRGTKIRLAWLECSDINLLPSIEQALIDWFQPELNRNSISDGQAIIQVMVTPEDKTIFDTACKANGTTMSEVLRSAIDRYLAKGK